MSTTTNYNCDYGLCTIFAEDNKIFRFSGDSKYLRFGPENGLIRLWCAQCGDTICLLSSSTKKASLSVYCLEGI